MDEIVQLESADWRERVSRQNISVSLAALTAARVTLGVVGTITNLNPTAREPLLRNSTDRMLQAIKE